MDQRRIAVLNLLGIEQWQLREADIPARATAETPMAVAATVDPLISAMPLSIPTTQPLAAAGPVAAVDWNTLKAEVASCMRCKLCKTRTNTVFGIGNDAADLMVVGEGPGADEDASGEPFVGRAGKLLDEMLKSIDRARSRNVFIANVVKCRPPGNRDPEPEEVQACRSYLDQQIAHVKPRLIVALGRVAAQRLLGSDEPLARLRGPLHRYGAAGTPVFVTYHPAYLLRSPKEKAKSWDDLKKVWQFLQAPPAPARA
jgi:uracil-DNA glycosylase